MVKKILTARNAVRYCRSAWRTIWRTRRAGTAVAAGFFAATAISAATRCVIPPASMRPVARLVEASDFVRLRDFGDLGTEGSNQALAVSRDGKHVVVQLRQGQPGTNNYCTALVVVALDGVNAPRAIADTGDIVPDTTDLYGMADMTLGAPQTAPAAWSPSGAWIAFIKTRANGAEIWRVRPDGRDPNLVYSSPVPVEELAWSADGKRLVISSAPSVVDARRLIAAEGLSGFHYDARFWPLASMVPHPLAQQTRAIIQSIDLSSGGITEADADDASLFTQNIGPDWPNGTRIAIDSPRTNLQAWALPDHPGWIRSQLALHVRFRGQEFPCSYEACRDIVGLWLLNDQSSLLFLHRTGVARSRTELYRWVPGQGVPKRLFATNDAIFGCHQSGDALVCAYEASRQPREVVRVDGRDGEIRTLFNPNPEWRTLRLGQPKRLTWRNELGIETFGDLVLPTGYVPGKRVPLVVVQYESRGFLRGGTADDYPIQLYAAHGFAVLSFNRPPFFAIADGPKPASEFGQINLKGWADRRSVQSSLESVIRQLDAQGIIDPTRVGITGQSDGASTATFALLHSHLFAAAALSTCCEDSDIMALLGEGFARTYAGMGYPRAGKDPPDFWGQSSLDLHADRPSVPILIQASDQEARMGLRTYTILKDAGWPIDMFIFPDEGHVKLQPAHRLAMFERSLTWFQRWLMSAPAAGTEPAPGAQPQPVAHASTSTH